MRIANTRIYRPHKEKGRNNILFVLRNWSLWDIKTLRDHSDLTPIPLVVALITLLGRYCNIITHWAPHILKTLHEFWCFDKRIEHKRVSAIANPGLWENFWIEFFGTGSPGMNWVWICNGNQHIHIRIFFDNLPYWKMEFALRPH